VSLENRLLMRVVFPATRGKQLWEDAAHTRDYIADRAVRPAKFAPPRRLDRRAEVGLRHRDGWPVYELAPRQGSSVAHILYFHGGAYINEISYWHWWFLGRIVQRAPARATVPIYPLGTAAGAERTVASATELAAELIETVGAERVVLMGDSAGGGLALAVGQGLRDRGVRPRGLVLMAPWLDLATDNPASRAIADRDPMLAIPGLIEAARTYAGSLGLDDARVSPLHGSLDGLPPITVFTGTDDLLNPDSRRLAEACVSAGVSCELIETAEQPHVYPVLPTREGQAARRQIISLLRGDRVRA
jgi:epsilon-lactone hydrolase